MGDDEDDDDQVYMENGVEDFMDMIRGVVSRNALNSDNENDPDDADFIPD